MKSQKTKFENVEIVVKSDTPTFTDKKTGVKSVGYTFDFPSGVNGFIVITKLVKGKWEVINDIKKITIQFND